MIVVFYYTQSGQALDVAKRICRPLAEAGTEVVWRPIIPQQTYPFPWNKYEFFDSFPETRLGMPPSGIQPLDFSGIEKAELVMIVGQSWFLSPSLPLQSFFENEQVKAYLEGKKVVFVNACRNMWLMTGRAVKAYLHEIKACQVGHIVLQDTAPNLISALTIVRWLLYGKKQSSWLLPAAGVRNADIEDASRFGDIIKIAASGESGSPYVRSLGTLYQETWRIQGSTPSYAREHLLLLSARGTVCGVTLCPAFFLSHLSAAPCREA